MVCYLSCTIASGFIFASLFTMFATKKTMLANDLRSILTPEQDEMYKSIVEERTRLYLHGLVIGLLLGVIYLYLTRKDKNLTRRLCVFTLITMGAQYFYYTLIPKKRWMLDYLDTKEANQKWLEMYKYMKYQYHLGFLFGIVGYTILAYGLCRDKK